MSPDPFESPSTSVCRLIVVAGFAYRADFARPNRIPRSSASVIDKEGILTGYRSSESPLASLGDIWDSLS